MSYTIPFPSGYKFTSGVALRAHFRSGGFAQVNAREKWYRAIANRLEVLHDKLSEWERASWDLDDLVKMEDIISCDEPQLSKDIAERDRVISEIGARQPRPPATNCCTANPCKCEGCEEAAKGISILNTTYQSDGLIISFYGHGKLLAQYLGEGEVRLFHAEMSRWLEARNDGA